MPSLIIVPMNCVRLTNLVGPLRRQKKDELVDTIIVKTQGFVNGNIKKAIKIRLPF